MKGKGGVEREKDAKGKRGNAANTEDVNEMSMGKKRAGV